MRVRDIMTTQVLTVSPDTPIQRVIALLSGQAISGVPVVDGERVVGILTEGDLVMREKPLRMPATVALLGTMIVVDNPARMLEDLRRHVGATAADVMTREVVGIGPDVSIEEAARLMYDRDFKRLPVVEDGRLVGIVTRKDLIRSLL